MGNKALRWVPSALAEQKRRDEAEKLKSIARNSAKVLRALRGGVP